MSHGDMYVSQRYVCQREKGGVNESQNVGENELDTDINENMSENFHSFSENSLYIWVLVGDRK